MDEHFKVLSGSSSDEKQVRKSFYDLYRKCPIPEDELLTNIGLFINRQTLSRYLFMDFIYKKIIGVHGIICEFGVRWGQNLALFSSLRGIYEPYNYNRKIVGFDTFKGFPSTDEKDGTSDAISIGAYSVTEGYEEFLNKILEYHQFESPIPNIKKYELIKGDAAVTIDRFLEKNPETIIALAFFDFDLYMPTKKCLESIREHLTKGSILIFDELNFHEFPGETLALKETIGLTKYKIRRTPLNPLISYIIID